MRYQIDSRSDLLAGASVTVRIPEEDLDKKALYTIQKDMPYFVIPFSSRNVDGEMEFTYKIGLQSKLQYLSGIRTPGEYVQLWSGALKPLLICGDWFMKPYSLILSADYLYYDRNKNSICYLYIPSVADCSEHSSLREMAAEFSKYISVADAALESKVLRAIIMDFNPKEFLKMLEASVAAEMPMVQAPGPIRSWIPEQENKKALQGQAGIYTKEPAVVSQQEIFVPEPAALMQPDRRQGIPGDICINIPAKGKAANKAKESGNGRKEAREKRAQRWQPAQDAGVNENRNRRRSPVEVIDAIPISAYDQPDRVSRVYRGVPVFSPPTEMRDVTQIFSEPECGSRLRLVGSVLLPPVINVTISAGGIFTIGRFDAVVGRQQSSFEFDKKTKAVSRRHAAIERSADIYLIIDLASSAGTYLNGQKLMPNTPCELGHGCRVSFGNAGADYVWEV